MRMCAYVCVFVCVFVCVCVGARAEDGGWVGRDCQHRPRIGVEVRMV